VTPVLEASAAVHDALVADGSEGTVAKRTNGRYRCGHRSMHGSS
jgi:ATP-dependent DNA ligase